MVGGLHDHLGTGNHLGMVLRMLLWVLLVLLLPPTTHFAFVSGGTDNFARDGYFQFDGFASNGMAFLETPVCCLFIDKSDKAKSPRSFRLHVVPSDMKAGGR